MHIKNLYQKQPIACPRLHLLLRKTTNIILSKTNGVEAEVEAAVEAEVEAEVEAGVEAGVEA